MTDREIPLEVRRRRRVRRAGVSIATALLLLAAGAILLQWLRPAAKRSELRFARVARGAAVSTLRATGVVVPLSELVVSSPLEATVQRAWRRAGDAVVEGDELLALDISAARLEAGRLADRAAQQESEYERLRLSLDEAIATLFAQRDQKKLDAEIFRYAAEQKATLRAAGLLAEQDARAATASAQKAEIEVRQLGEAVARAQRSRQVQLAAAAASLATVRRDRDEAQRQLQLSMLRAPRRGVITWIVEEQGRSVRRGELVARIADLSAFRINGTIADIHASKLASGLPVSVRLDRWRGSGRVESVDPRIDQGIASFTVLLDAPSDPRLRNNLRVELEVASDRAREGLLLPRTALISAGGDSLFVVRGNALNRVPVRFGLAGNDVVEISDGLREGDEVVVSDMTAYEGIDNVRLDAPREEKR